MGPRLEARTARVPGSARNVFGRPDGSIRDMRSSGGFRSRTPGPWHREADDLEGGRGRSGAGPSESTRQHPGHTGQ